MRDFHVPISEKFLLTIQETAEYTNIGENRLRELCKKYGTDFVLEVGSKKLIKRKEFEKFISRHMVL